MAEVGAVKAACDAVVEHLHGSRVVQVLLASRTSVPQMECKCCSRRMQARNFYGSRFTAKLSQQNAHNKQVTVKRYLDKP